MIPLNGGLQNGEPDRHPENKSKHYKNKTILIPLTSSFYQQSVHLQYQKRNLEPFPSELMIFVAL